MKPAQHTTATGFTLLELLVAIAIFSFLATATFTAINQIVIAREIVDERSVLMSDLQRTVRLLNTDFSQLHPRSVRDELGRDRIAALSSDPSEDFSIQLSRDGWRNPARSPRGTLQRVQYRLDENTLIREYWPVMDHMLGDEPRSVELLQNVDEIEIAFMNESGEWEQNWPPADDSERIQARLPVAVRYKFTIANFGVVERLIETPR
jgi:general secretion pathway protein J